MDSADRVTGTGKTRMGVESERADREFWARWRPLNGCWKPGAWAWSSGSSKDGRRVNQGFLALLRELFAAEARFLVVEAYALAHYARPRATGDMNIWVDRSAENAPRVHRAL